MRKLLLSTTALMTAAALSSAAFADVSISGSMEFTYESIDPGASAVTGASNDLFSSDQDVHLKFSNKTDSGLDIAMVMSLQVAADTAAATAANTMVDESYMTISGGFGTLQLGGNDGAGDQLTRTAHDLLGPDALNDGGPTFQSSTGNLVDDNADLMLDIDDGNNITYMLPKMGGLTIGASYEDNGSGASANADEQVFAAKYDFTSGAVKGSLHLGVNNISGATAGAVSRDAQSMGIDISSGPFRAVMAKAEADSTTASVKTEVTDYGIQYNLGNGIVLTAVGTQVEENTGSETLDVTSVGAKYNIASGLDAYLTYHDYDYKAGDSGATSDDGSSTSMTIKASF
ncbi:porin [Alphaproteobacteria bacterium]|nr:porin [Alphaproteobacteria bacterium]